MSDDNRKLSEIIQHDGNACGLTGGLVILEKMVRCREIRLFVPVINMFPVRFDANVFVITSSFLQIELRKSDAVIAFNFDFP